MLPSQLEYPREHAKDITLQSKKQLPKVEIKKQEEGDIPKEEIGTKLKEGTMDKKKEMPLKTPPLPFPQRQQQSKLDKQFKKFIQSFQ